MSIHILIHTQAARSYGYALVSRSPGRAIVTTPTGGLLVYHTLHVLEFDSERKCMSVIVKEDWSGRILLYSKGADVVIFSNLAHPDTGVLVGSGEGRRSEGREGEEVGSGGRRGEGREGEKVGNGGRRGEGREGEKVGNGGRRREGEEVGSGGRRGEEREGEEVGSGGRRSERRVERKEEEEEAGGGERENRRELTETHLTVYAKDGLRTLCMARRVKLLTL